MKSSKRLTREEEVALFKAGKTDEVIVAHGDLVHAAARRYAKGRRHLLDDLVQEGWVGLVLAAGKFDITRGIRFHTYARHWVKSKIVEYLWFTRRLAQAPNSWDCVRALRAMNKGDVASPEDLALRARVTPFIAEAMYWMYGSVELRTERTHADGESYEWLTSDSDPERDVAEALDAEVLKAAIVRAIDLASEKQREALRAMYSGGEVASVRDVAAAIGTAHAPAANRIERGLRCMSASKELRDMWDAA